MEKHRVTLAIAFFLSFTFITQANQPPGNKNDGGLSLPEGFKSVVVAEDVGPGRHIAVRDNGDIYLQLRNNPGEGSTVALRDQDGDGKADIKKYFGNLPGTGIRVHKGYLYTSTDTSVQRYKFTGDALLPEPDPEIIVGGFKSQNQHAAKPFTFDGEGNMYVTVGAPSNACMKQMRTKGSPGMDP